MFPYGYFVHIKGNKNNQSSDVLDCVVHEADSLFSSCIFTFGFYYLLPLSIIGLCYLRVLVHIRRTGYQMVKRLVSYQFRSHIIQLSLSVSLTSCLNIKM